MSDATEQPADHRPRSDADAWETACAEDLAAERARRRERYGPPPGSAAEELRRLAEAVTDKLSGIQLPASLTGMAAQGAVNQLIKQARSAVEPVIDRHSDVFDHLSAAGSELLAAYRSAVHRQEHRWTAEEPRPTGDAAPGDRPRDTPPGEDGPPGSERIDLD